MKLVIYSNKPFENQEKWVKKLFCAVPNKDLIRPKIADLPFDSKNLQKLIKISPVKDRHRLKLTWIIQEMNQFYKKKPEEYLTHLLGHEGPNSLLSLLIDEGLASELVVGVES